MTTTKTMITKQMLTVCGALALSSFAWASAEDFAISFPKMVCSDGWAACLDGDEEVSVDSIKDSSGIFHRADARVSFFTFEKLPSFSPFGELSAYNNDEPVAVVEAVAEPAEEVQEIKRSAQEKKERKEIMKVHLQRLKEFWRQPMIRYHEQ